MFLFKLNFGQLRLAAIVLTITVLFLLAAFGQNTNKPQRLLPNQPIEREIKGGETQEFQFELKKGEYARVEVEQEKVGIIVTLYDADGKQIIEMDSKTGRLWYETVSCIAEKKGFFKIKIEAFSITGQIGSYTVRFTEKRKSVPDDSKRLEAETHLNMGRKFFDQNSKMKEAAMEFELAARLWNTVGESKLMGMTLANLGLTYSRLRMHEQAIETEEKALEIFNITNDRNIQSIAFVVIGNSYLSISRYDEAINFYEKALIVKRELNQLRSEGLTLANIGLAYFRLANYEQAIDFYKRALDIHRKAEDKIGEGTTLNKLGSVYERLAQFEKAIDYYEQSLEKIEENLSEKYWLFISLGNVYDKLGRYEKAGSYYQQSLEIGKILKDPRRESGSLLGMGIISYRLKQFKEAKEYYEQALEINKEANDLQGKGVLLNNLGVVYEDLKQYEAAINYYKKAIDVRKKIKDRYGEGLTLAGLGNVYIKLSKFKEARDYYEQALIIAKEINNRNNEGAIYADLFVMSERLNEPKLAILYGKQAVNIYQEIRNNIKNLEKEVRESFLADKVFVYRRLADLLISEGRLSEAQAILNLIKQEEYEQISVRRSGENADTIPYSKAETKAIAKIDQLAELARRKSELEKQEKEKGSLTEAEQKELDKIFADIETVNKAFGEAIKKLTESDSSVEKRLDDIGCEKEGFQNNKCATSLQKTLLEINRNNDSGAVAIYTVIGTDSENAADGKESRDKTRSKFGWVILVTPDSRKAYPIDVKDLEETVFQFRNALSSDRYDPQPLAEKLYAAIFRQTSDKQKQNLEADLEKLLAQYKDKMIMWSLDGVLRYIPMAALHDGKNYLVEKYRHIVFTKESLTYFNDEDSPNWQALGLGVSEAKTVKDSLGDKDVSFSAIPGTEKELNDIVKTSKEDDGFFGGTIRLNKDFTKDEAIKLWRQGKYPVVHIASHFSFNPVDQTASFLLVGDGKLTFADIKDKDILFGTVDLLTMSACDTAMSSNGKESEGFAYLAQSLGAKTVLASLWKVSDAGTPELMIRFYKIRADNPQMSKGEAFRQAQLSLLNAGLEKSKENSNKTTGKNGKDKRTDIVPLDDSEIKLPLFEKTGKPKFAHPYYWASFVLIGNWR